MEEENRCVMNKDIESFREYLMEMERSENTIDSSNCRWKKIRVQSASLFGAYHYIGKNSFRSGKHLQLLKRPKKKEADLRRGQPGYM